MDITNGGQCNNVAQSRNVFTLHLHATERSANENWQLDIEGAADILHFAGKYALSHYSLLCGESSQRPSIEYLFHSRIRAGQKIVDSEADELRIPVRLARVNSDNDDRYHSTRTRFHFFKSMMNWIALAREISPFYKAFA